MRMGNLKEGTFYFFLKGMAGFFTSKMKALVSKLSNNPIILM